MATIRDIAQRAHVSVSTASLALNGDARVRADTRARILQVAEELEYRPNRAARSLSSGKAWTIDVINPADGGALTSSFHTRFLHGIHDAARHHQYAVALKVVDDEAEALTTVERLILERATDGVVLMNPSDNEALVSHLRQRDFPHVVLGRAGGRTARSVDSDNRAAAADATRHLLQRGRAPILFLSGPERQTFTRDRLRGHRSALLQAGIDDAPLTGASDGTAEGARRLLHQRLQEGPAFRGVLALSDAMAVGALRAAREAGLRVPDDLAIMGMNDDEMTDYTDPRLSSVDLRPFELGRRAAAALLDALHGGDAVPARSIVPHAVKPREST